MFTTMFVHVDVYKGCNSISLKHWIIQMIKEHISKSYSTTSFKRIFAIVSLD